MKRNTLKGFTVIEVALVLAIAGLIFLMMFVALPGLRASQRDTERREDVLELVSKIKKYQNNNRGSLPSLGSLSSTKVQGDRIIDDPNDEDYSEWEGFYSKYLGDNFTDPNGETYNLFITQCARGSLNVGEACNRPDVQLADSTFPNGYKIVIVLQATCGNEQALASSNPRKVAVLYRLESSGVFCSNT